MEMIKVKRVTESHEVLKVTVKTINMERYLFNIDLTERKFWLIRESNTGTPNIHTESYDIDLGEVSWKEWLSQPLSFWTHFMFDRYDFELRMKEPTVVDMIKADPAYKELLERVLEIERNAIGSADVVFYNDARPAFLDFFQKGQQECVK